VKDPTTPQQNEYKEKVTAIEHSMKRGLKNPLIGFDGTRAIHWAIEKNMPYHHKIAAAFISPKFSTYINMGASNLGRSSKPSPMAPAHATTERGSIDDPIELEGDPPVEVASDSSAAEQNAHASPSVAAGQCDCRLLSLGEVESGEALQVVISLAGVRSMADVDVSLTAGTQLEIQLVGAAAPATKPALLVSFPKPVNIERSGAAKFSKKTGVLRMKLWFA
jgi:hypothetical protein